MGGPRAPIRVRPGPTRLRPLNQSPSRWFATGWPLKYLLVGFPVWWILGLGTFVFLLVALPMAIELRRWSRVGRLALPPAWWLWMLFLAWKVLGLLVLAETPPGTHGGSVSGRSISIAFSMVAYASMTITVLYVGNLWGPDATDDQDGDDPASTAIGHWMSVFFLTVWAGGMLGVVAPGFSFRSPMELLLPDSLASQPYVAALVHPVAAQVQDVIGVADARPAAPFGYTNWWGHVVSILLVWFIAVWILTSRGWRRVGLVLIALSTAIPLVLSLNRGVWIGLAVTLVWVVARLLWQRRIAVAAPVLIAGATLLAIVVASPLGSVIAARLDRGGSTSLRAFVARLSWEAIQHSPVVGYGGNRHSDGSVNSIGAGPTPDCLDCGSVPTGSTGQLWAMLFDHGVVGTIFFFGFFAVILWRYRRARGAVNEAALITVMLVFVYMFFYTTVPVATMLTMIAVGVLWRIDTTRGSEPMTAVSR